MQAYLHDLHILASRLQPGDARSSSGVGVLFGCLSYLFTDSAGHADQSQERDDHTRHILVSLHFLDTCGRSVHPSQVF